MIVLGTAFTEMADQIDKFRTCHLKEASGNPFLELVLMTLLTFRNTTTGRVR